MTVSTISERDSLEELLNSAKTEEDLKALQSLIDERDASRSTSDDRWNVRTLGEVADFLGLKLQTIKQWRTQANPMPGVPGKFNLRDIVQWYREKSAPTNQTSERQRLSDIRLKTAQAEAKEIENEKTRGNLVLLSEVEYTFSHAVIECRESFMAISDTIANTMPPEHREFVRSEIDRVVRSTLKQFKRNLETASIGTDDDGPIPDSQPNQSTEEAISP